MTIKKNADSEEKGLDFPVFSVCASVPLEDPQSITHNDDNFLDGYQGIVGKLKDKDSVPSSDGNVVHLTEFFRQKLIKDCENDTR